MIKRRPTHYHGPNAPYQPHDEHPTLRCPECDGPIRYEPHVGRSQRHYWPCAAQPRCPGYRAITGSGYEPDPVLRITRDQRALLKQEMAIFERDELCGFDDALAVVHGAMTERDALSRMRREDYSKALAALAALRQRLLAARHVVARPTRERCCEVTRDAFGALTVCYEARRWCLGVADHARRPGHTENLRGETWGEADDEEALREDAQEAFLAADSRRRGNLRRSA